MNHATSQRIDKWLWAARFYKTRQLCIKAIKNSRVKINGNICKPSSSLVIGNHLEIKRGAYPIIVEVDGLNEKRGSAPIARTLYHETQESIQTRTKLQEQLALQPKIETSLKKPDRRSVRTGRDIKRNW